MMTKEALLALWHGENWENTIGGIYFVSHQFEKDIHFNFTGYGEEELSSMPDSFIKKLTSEIHALDKRAKHLIQAQCYGDNLQKLALTDVLFDKSDCYGAFALGYYVGESLAGELYVLVKFDDNFQADSELIYEVY